MDEPADGQTNRRGPRGGLSDAERADADAEARAIDGTRRFLGSRAAPDLTGAVLRRIADVEPASATRGASVLRRAGARLWQPVNIAIRPAYALAGAALTAGLLLGAPALRAPGTAPMETAAAPPLLVQFRLEASASSVQLMGSFTGWERRYELQQTAPGLWSITIPLAEGVHDYAFLVDGRQWVADPYASQVSDGFGGINSRLTLLRPGDTTTS